MQIGEFGADEPDWLYDEEYGCWYSSWDIAEWSQEDEYWEQHPDDWEQPASNDDDAATQPDPDAEEEPSADSSSKGISSLQLASLDWVPTLPKPATGSLSLIHISEPTRPY